MDPRLDEAAARLDDLTEEVKLLRGTVSALRASRKRPTATHVPSHARTFWVVLGCLIALVGLAVARWVAAQCE